MKLSEDFPETVPVSEAARLMGTTSLSVLMHIKRKLLVGREIDGAWHVTRDSLERLDSAAAGLCRSRCPSSGGCSDCG